MYFVGAEYILAMLCRIAGMDQVMIMSVEPCEINRL
jgi:hypothetical protein